MKFKNHELEALAQILFDIPLKGKESRMRTRFLAMLTEHLGNVVNKEKQFLIEEYADRNLDGTIKTSEENPNDIYIQKEKQDEFYKEFNDLMNEDFHIEENEANKMVLLTVADIMLNGDFEVSGDVAVLYDKWCDQFEEVKAKYVESED